MRIKVIVTCWILLLFHAGYGYGASFDCAQASRPLEKTICSNTQLSIADEEMARYYLRLKESLDPQESQGLLDEQRAWLKRRTENCTAGNSTCLIKLYNDRVHALRVKYENLVPFILPETGSLQGVVGPCAFTGLTIPDGALIYAGGAYSGRKLSTQIDQSGHESTQFDVVVNSPHKPTVLLLGAYEPSIWNIGWTKGTKILAVVATGYHRQAIAGLPKDTPLLVSTYDNRGPCGYTFISEKTLPDVNPLLKRVYGKPADMVYFANDGRVVMGESVRQNEELFTSRDVTPESFINTSKPLAGPAGLRDALAKGILRQATKDDAESWATRKASLVPKDALPPVSGRDSRRAFLGPHGSNVYVIQKPYELPAGLYGGNSAQFYLLEGVEFPKGELGHSSIFDFNTMTCRGARCLDH